MGESCGVQDDGKTEEKQEDVATVPSVRVSGGSLEGRGGIVAYAVAGGRAEAKSCSSHRVGVSTTLGVGGRGESGEKEEANTQGTQRGRTGAGKAGTILKFSLDGVWIGVSSRCAGGERRKAREGG